MENTTNVTETVSEPDIPLVYTISYGAIFPTICIIGLVGNILTLIVVCQEKKPTSSAILILSLSISDSFVLISRLIFVLFRVSEMYFPNLSKNLSKYVPSYALLIVTIYLQKVSKMILVQIGVERLFAVWFPLKTKLICSPRKSLVFVVALIAIVSAISIPIIVNILVTYQNIISKGGEVYTGVFATLKDLIRYYLYITEVYKILFLVSRYSFDFFPLIFLAMSSCLIIIGIKRSSLDTRRGDRKNQSKQITKTLLCICIVFVVLCLPNDFLSVALNSFGVTIQGYFYVIFDIMSTTNNAINFFFYCAFHTTYRQHYKRLVMCRSPMKINKHNFLGQQESSSSNPNPVSSISFIESSSQRHNME